MAKFRFKSTIVTLFLLTTLSFAQRSTAVYQLSYICYNIKQTVPIMALLMFIMAGAIYAIGQIMGAETRARASVWATAMLLGGILGLIIAASAQFLLTTFAQFSLGREFTSMQTEGWCGPFSPAPP